MRDKIKASSQPFRDGFKRLGVSQTDLAKAMGVSLSSVSLWLKNERIPAYANILMECMLRRRGNGVSVEAAPEERVYVLRVNENSDILEAVAKMSGASFTQI